MASDKEKDRSLDSRDRGVERNGSGGTGNTPSGNSGSKSGSTPSSGDRPGGATNGGGNTPSRDSGSRSSSSTPSREGGNNGSTPSRDTGARSSTPSRSSDGSIGAARAADRASVAGYDSSRAATPSRVGDREISTPIGLADPAMRDQARGVAPPSSISTPIGMDDPARLGQARGSLGPTAGTPPVGGGFVSMLGATPTHRQTEIASMAALDRQRMGAIDPKAMNAQSAALNRTRAANAAAPSFRQTEEQAMAKEEAWQNALAEIRSVEGKYGQLGYASPAFGRSDNPDFSNMTLRELRDWQEKTDNSKNKSHKADRSYVGAYQIGKSALEATVARTGLSWDTKFSPATEDYIARELTAARANKGAVDGKVNTDSLAKGMAYEWAGLATSNGKSAYDGRAGNAAGNTYAGTRAAAEGLVSTGALGNQAPTQTRATSTTAVSRFADRYLSNNLPDTVDVTPSSGMDAKLATAHANNAAYRSDAPASPYVDNIPGLRSRSPGPAPAPIERVVSPPVSYDDPPTIQSPAGPAVAPVSPSQPSTVVTPTAPPAVEDKPPSIGRQIAAGAIDVGLGMIPGVGIAATVYNGFAALTGRESIGGLALDLLGDGSRINALNGDREGGEDRGSSGSVLPIYSAANQPGTTIREPDQSASTFASRYLRPTQTPGERWPRIPVQQIV